MAKPARSSNSSDHSWVIERLLLRSLRIVAFSTVTVLIFITSILINLVQLVNYILLEFTLRNVRRRINAHLQDIILSQTTIILEYYCGVQFRLFYANQETKDKFGKEHCLVMGNHRFQVDAFFYWFCCQMTHSLGSAKAYAKSDLRWMPIIGWVFVFGDFIFLKRNWREDSKSIGPALDRLMSYPFPYVLLILPEGTRFTPEKHQASLTYAKEHNIPINLKYHLVPRVKGFATSLRHLQTKYENNFGVYHIQLVSHSTHDSDAFEPSLQNILTGKPFKVDCFLEKIDNSRLPPGSADEETEAKFVYSVFEQKDKLMEYHQQHHRFPSSLMRTKERDLYRLARFILLNFVASGSLVLYFVYLAIVTHSLTLRVTIFGIIFSAFVGLFLIISLLQNSSYGQKKGKSTGQDSRSDESKSSNGITTTQQVHT